MKLGLHHIEMCVKDSGPVLHTLCNQFGLKLVGERETGMCTQSVVKMGKTVFIITCRKRSQAKKVAACDSGDVGLVLLNGDSNGHGEIKSRHNLKKESVECKSSLWTSTTCRLSEPWTVFCCEDDNGEDGEGKEAHIDSVFNIALEVTGLPSCIDRLKAMGCMILQDLTQTGDQYGTVNYAIVKSCCGNVIHTLIEKINYSGWFLPEFQPTVSHPNSVNLPSSNKSSPPQCEQGNLNSYFDHVALVCRVGETTSIIRWYQEAFEMKRFITNRQESEEEGLVIGEDVGMRLKVMEFWKCSEVGIASSNCSDSVPETWEELKIVIAESLPALQNTQVENFIKDHKGPGLQHIGLHTSDMVTTVEELVRQGVRFRQPPPTYYTHIGQLQAIESMGEDAELFSKYGILLDTEADPFDENDNNETEDPSTSTQPNRYLMQIFTYPIFDRDTFFLEVLQRKGARGFGVGNVTALARSVNAYQKLLQSQRNQTQGNNDT